MIIIKKAIHFRIQDLIFLKKSSEIDDLSDFILHGIGTEEIFQIILKEHVSIRQEKYIVLHTNRFVKRS